MGYLTPRRKRDDEDPGGGTSLHLDLDERVCPQCRRTLPPWQDRCPDDGAAAVDRTALPPPIPPPPPHLLEGLEEDDA
ncbi:MAG TPA: hypothetical protein VIK95_01180 [Egibacteraceae bacterium]